ncbi:alpha-L-fucosidase [Sphingomonas sp.]|uniref:alpha-L-fucosidase n=1 Tax=Sphingomonas sp. TaxID=28214 RepID=UPI0025D87CC4|nr:alpha-L-fucosidase [Sphingomonas sp.]
MVTVAASAMATATEAQTAPPKGALGVGPAVAEGVLNPVKPYTAARQLDPVTAKAMERFNQDRFALFVHWGVYAEAAGVIRGKRWYGASEWLMHNSRTPTAEYLELAGRFNPVDFDARRWVRMVKDAGIRYIVITAKHHDGFAMFKSKVSKRNIVDGTPFHRDPLKELAEAAKAEGIGLGFYYSQFQDWTEPNGAGNDWEYDPKKADFREYFDRKVVPQVTELLTNYGPVREIWFDTPGTMPREYSERLRALVKKLQPECLLNSRIGNGLGDYASPGDSEVTPARRAQGNSEVIFTHNRSWGYSSIDNDYKSTDTLITLLVSSASRGSNFMINTGPDGKGHIPADAEKKLLGVGAWLKVNGESVYGTTRSPLPQMPWGVATQRANKLYLHVLAWPRDGILRIPGFVGDVTRASMLDGGETLTIAKDAGLAITLPIKRPDTVDAVVVVETQAPLADAHMGPIGLSTAYGRQILEVADADIVGQGPQLQLVRTQLYMGDLRKYYTVTGLDDPAKAITWKVQVDAAGDYHVDLEYSATAEQAGKEGWVISGDQKLPFGVVRSGVIERRAPAFLPIQPVGILHFPAAGIYTIAVSPQKAGSELFKPRTLYVTPAN